MKGANRKMALASGCEIENGHKRGNSYNESHDKKFWQLWNTIIALHGCGEYGQGVRCYFYCHFTKKTKIGNNCSFNGMDISGNGMVIIGDNFHCGKHIRIITSFHNYDHGIAIPYDESCYERDVIIEENVWLGEDVLVLGGVRIGEGAVIQAGSVVSKDVPPLAIAGGHPAVPFKYRDQVHYYELKKARKFS